MVFVVGAAVLRRRLGRYSTFARRGRHTRLRALVVLGATLLALVFVGGSSALARSRNAATGGRNLKGRVPRLGLVIPRTLPPFIAYTHEKYENGQLTIGVFGTESDGSQTHALTPMGVYAQDPAWSPDGTKIVYTTSCSIWMMNADGSNEHPVISADASGDPCFVQPHWGPNGKRIVYSSQENSGGTVPLQVADADGSHNHRVPNASGAQNASFSPDGRYLVFDRFFNRQGKPKPRIYVIRPNGRGLRQITTDGPAADPSWSPDGERIIYSCAFYGNPYSHLAVIGPGSPHAICEVSREHPFPKTLYSVDSESEIDGQTWSADGRAILFSAPVFSDSVPTEAVELVAPGGTPVEITSDGYNWGPDW